MKKIELLAPAGDLEKLKVALIYGADAVFIGGKKFSLRSRASNFSLEDIEEGCKFAHSLGKKVHVTCNIVMHNNDLDGLDEYLLALDKIGVDAIITSSLFMAKRIKELTKIEVHISTQESSLNSEACSFFFDEGADRVVLARECSLDDMKSICKKKKGEIEAFVHGGMCSSYSGRCMLSNLMTNRDANRGGCAHSCRWKYKIYSSGKEILKENEYFSMSGKDLCGIKFVPDLIDIGVDSLKIEGRMKSLNYIACICKAYRMCINDYILGNKMNFEHYLEYIDACENRDTSIGFFNGELTKEQQLFDLDKELKKAGEFVGYITSYDEKTKIAKMILRNKIISNKGYILLTPSRDFEYIFIGTILNKKGEEIDQYSIANEEISFISEKTLNPFDIIRLKK